jgi:hypothetical protein
MTLSNAPRQCLVLLCRACCLTRCFRCSSTLTATCGAAASPVSPDRSKPPAQRRYPGLGEKPGDLGQRARAYASERGRAVSSRYQRTLTQTAIATGTGHPTRLTRLSTGPIWRSTPGCRHWAFTLAAVARNSPPSAWTSTGGPPNGQARRAPTRTKSFRAPSGKTGCSLRYRLRINIRVCRALG